MELATLIDALPDASVDGNANLEISAISLDSRNAGEAAIFACVPGKVGANEDRLKFAGDALERGCKCLLMPSGSEEMFAQEGITRIFVDDVRRATARLACKLNGDPSANLHLICVTGTNGKTTVTQVTSQILACLGVPNANIGNLGLITPDGVFAHRGNTPEAPVLQGYLRSVADQGISTVVMEASSHSLDQDRVFGCDCDVAVFTNLSQDHLDYHGDMETYLESKARLFRGLSATRETQGPKWAVLNADAREASELANITKAKVLRFGIRASEADVVATDIRMGRIGVAFTVHLLNGETHSVETNFIGDFNVYNILAALTTLMASGYSMRDLVQTLPQIQPPPGRMQVISTIDKRAIVDFAHTPDAMENCISSIRPFCKGRITVVFGCGGERDVDKRPIMGKIASTQADYVIVTSDNPRNEAPEQITQDIAVGIVGENFEIILDRRTAIERALNGCLEDDYVLVLGKGDEKHQTIGSEAIPFSDADVIASLLSD